MVKKMAFRKLVLELVRTVMIDFDGFGSREEQGNAAGETCFLEINMRSGSTKQNLQEDCRIELIN